MNPATVLGWVVAAWLALCLGALAFCAMQLRRNDKVYAERSRVIDAIADLCHADIALGRASEWRWKGYSDGPSYEEMVNKFWIPIEDFYKDAEFLRAKEGD